MDVLRAMRVFRRVVELQQFSAAARDQRMSNAAVSKEIAMLEDRLRAKLLHRTTRRLSLTTAGAAYYEKCVRILEELDDIERSTATSSLAGTLRVNVPMSFGVLHVAPLLPIALRRYPELDLSVSFTDRLVDLVEEGADVVIRIASQLPDAATLVVQRLARSRHVVCASPEYLKKRGEPTTPDDLAQHDCLVYQGDRAGGVWTLGGPGGPVRLRPRGRLVVDNSLVLRDALLAGAGIALIPAFYIGAELESGRLRAVLTKYEPKPIFIHALSQRSRHASARVRAFVELLRTSFAKAEWALR